MLVSLEWLQAYVDLSGLAPDDIAEALTNAGLEVEDVELKGGAFSKVVVAHVDKVEPHPNADRLRLVTVNLGDTCNQVVCGAPNVAEKMRIAYAQLGAQVINRKDGTLFELTPAKIRGVESTGMICSIDELGLSGQYESSEAGIWDITTVCPDAALGTDLKTALGLSAYAVLDTAPTANRGDHMSMLGVAREVAALFDRDLKIAPPGTLDPKGASCPIQVEIVDEAACSFYAGVLVEGITIGPSPDWLVRRLEDAGVRSINNVVDMTNYVMLEYGQPLHAFDANKIKALAKSLAPPTIGVRYARSGETMTTLDDIERTLTPQSALITLNDVPVALAGVMGGATTEIDDQATAVFLECAYFPSASTRLSSRSVGLRSESSARFERGIDAATCDAALARAVELLQKLAGGQVHSMVIDDRRQLQNTVVSLRLAQLERVLGMDVPQATVQQCLTHLGFTVDTTDNTTWAVTVPSYRADDVTREIDVIEEVIRVYGYNRIPYTLPAKTATPKITARQQFLNTIRGSLMASGLAEVSTASLIGPTLVEQTQAHIDESKAVRLTNSHSAEFVLMRQQLLPSLLDIALHNEAKGNQTQWFFELGRTYLRVAEPSEKYTGVTETLMLGGLVKGLPQAARWHQSKLKTLDFFVVKGMLEQLFCQLRLPQAQRWVAEATSPMMHPGQTATIKFGKQAVGIIGQLHPRLYDSLKLKGPVFVFELHVDQLWKLADKREPVKAHALSAYQAVERDLALTVPETISHQQIMAAFGQANEPLLKQIELFDMYAGEQVEAGHRSLAYRLTLQSNEGTLTDAQIAAALDQLTASLNQALNITVRS
ncbi:MAG: phenylalanine--tRNA ligase subunit beta [Cyanobacteria bacterium HKST-UBA06]|nr:phenylalanine--tRNA ligase subunit beta [Cyanobacteria bacterium HKST-UBA06]